MIASSKAIIIILAIELDLKVNPWQLSVKFSVRKKWSFGTSVMHVKSYFCQRAFPKCNYYIVIIRFDVKGYKSVAFRHKLFGMFFILFTASKLSFKFNLMCVSGLRKQDKYLASAWLVSCAGKRVSGLLGLI